MSSRINPRLIALGLASLPVEANEPFVDPLELEERFGTKIPKGKGNRSKSKRDKRKKRKIANASKRRNRK